jgi:hypothetical protein
MVRASAWSICGPGTPGAPAGNVTNRRNGLGHGAHTPSSLLDTFWGACLLPDPPKAGSREKNLPTPPQAPPANPRFPCSHENRQRSKSIEQSPPQGPASPDGYGVQEVDSPQSRRDSAGSVQRGASCLLRCRNPPPPRTSGFRGARGSYGAAISYACRPLGGACIRRISSFCWFRMPVSGSA